MLFTAGLSPVAHEFPLASESGDEGSELKPVVPEWPSTTMAFGYSLETGTTDGDAEVAVDPPSLAEQPESTSAAAAGRTSHQSPAGSDEAQR
jgi:hypothetical protein